MSERVAQNCAELRDLREAEGLPRLGVEERDERRQRVRVVGEVSLLERAEGHAVEEVGVRVVEARLLVRQRAAVLVAEAVADVDLLVVLEDEEGEAHLHELLAHPRDVGDDAVAHLVERLVVAGRALVAVVLQLGDRLLADAVVPEELEYGV